MTVKKKNSLVVFYFTVFCQLFTGFFPTEQSAVFSIPVDSKKTVNPGVYWGNPVKKKVTERALTFRALGVWGFD